MLTSFEEQHAAWLAQFTPEERAEKTARYEAFKIKAAAIEAELRAYRAEKEKRRAAGEVEVNPYGSGTVCKGFNVPSPKETGYAENMAYYYRLYYDPAVNNYRSWADVGRK